MGFFGRCTPDKSPWRLPVRMVLMVLALAACGGGASPQSSETSALSFQVVWDRPDYQRADLTDCLDVASVGATVVSADGVPLGEGGPWDCATGSGVITGLPANYFATIAVIGYNSDGGPLYSGQNSTPDRKSVV
jgi:hypothetical protein